MRGGKLWRAPKRDRPMMPPSSSRSFGEWTFSPSSSSNLSAEWDGDDPATEHMYQSVLERLERDGYLEFPPPAPAPAAETPATTAAVVAAPQKEALDMMKSIQRWTYFVVIALAVAGCMRVDNFLLIAIMAILVLSWMDSALWKRTTDAVSAIMAPATTTGQKEKDKK